MSREIGKKCNYFAIIFIAHKYIKVWDIRLAGNKKALLRGLKSASNLALAPHLGNGVRLGSGRKHAIVD
jgi:hypothetical protein